MPMEHAGTFRTRKDAEARRRLVDGWLAAGRDPRTELSRLSRPVDTMSGLAADWIASRRAIAESTRVEYRRHGDLIAERFPDPRAIHPADVREWIAELERHLSPGTIAGYVATLRMILDHAEIQPNPARHRSVELPARPRRTLNPPDGPDVLAVCKALPFQHRQAFVLMEQCALRVSEALALELQDLDRVGVRLHVRAEHSKTGRPRWVPCPPWLYDILVLPRSGNRQIVHNAIKRACKDAGVQPFGPHMLRHRRATLWHQQGVYATELAARLGHSRPSTSLDVYSHVRRLEEAPAQRLASLLR